MDKAALVCSVCGNTWNSTRHQPVALPACGHTFCRQCLMKMHNVHEENMKCPTCRKRHEGPKPEDLPPNFALLHLVDDDVQDASRKKESPQDVPQKQDHTAEKPDHSADSGSPKKPSDEPETNTKTSDDEKKSGTSIGTKALIGAAVGGVGCVIAAPFVLPAIGFTSAGIAGGSWAASMMSSAAIANGGGVAAGSLVATLQSFGAAGITAAGNAVIGAAGAAAGAAGTAGVAAAAKAASGGNNPEGDGDKDKPEENKAD